MPSNSKITEFDPGLPLRSPRMEAYCKERCVGVSQTQALIAAGYKKSIARIKPNYLEQNEKVRARIAWLAQDEVDLVRAKRKKLEAFLWLALETDRAEFYEILDVPLRAKDGSVVIDPSTGKPLTKKVEQLKSFNDLSDYQRQLIEGITYTERGKPNLRLVSKQYAHTELTKLLSVTNGIGKASEPDAEVRSMDEALDSLRERARKFGLTHVFSGPITVAERSITFGPGNHEDKTQNSE